MTEENSTAKIKSEELENEVTFRLFSWATSSEKCRDSRSTLATSRAMPILRLPPGTGKNSVNATASPPS
jgi:hypothetical protein